MAITTINIDLKNRQFQIKVDLNPDLHNEETILNHLHKGMYYEPDISQAMMRMIAPGDIVVDVGANIGLFTLLMAGLVGPSGRVLGFEPGNANLIKLARNIELSEFLNITLIPKPVSDEVRDAIFYINADDSGGNALWDPGNFPLNVLTRATPNSTTMQGTTLDSEFLVGSQMPTVIKIDTEGAELRVLQGAQNMLRDRKVPFIIAELNEFGLKQMRNSTQELRAFMAGFGYDMFALYSNGCLPKMIPIGTELRTAYIPNILFSTSEQVGRVWTEDWFDPNVWPAQPQA